MIFLDESGKRWRRIKLGTSLLGSTAIIPIALLSTAALLYLPNWGSFNLPTPFTASQPQVKSEQTSSSSANSKKNTSKSLAKPPDTADNSAPSPATPSSSGSSLSPSTTNSSAAPVTTPPATQPAVTPIQAEQGLANQPDQPGNSDYGRTHQPIRY